MTTPEIKAEVTRIVQTVLGYTEDISAFSSFHTLGADSLDEVEIIMDVERSFNIAIPDEDMENIRTIDEAVEYLERRLLKS